MDKDSPANLEEKVENSPVGAEDTIVRSGEKGEGKSDETLTTIEKQTKVLEFWFWN